MQRRRNTTSIEGLKRQLLQQEHCPSAGMGQLKWSQTIKICVGTKEQQENCIMAGFKKRRKNVDVICMDCTRALCLALPIHSNGQQAAHWRHNGNADHGVKCVVHLPDKMVLHNQLSVVEEVDDDGFPGVGHAHQHVRHRQTATGQPVRLGRGQMTDFHFQNVVSFQTDGHSLSEYFFSQWVLPMNDWHLCYLRKRCALH